MSDRSANFPHRVTLRTCSVAILVVAVILASARVIIPAIAGFGRVRHGSQSRARLLVESPPSGLPGARPAK